MKNINHENIFENQKILLHIRRHPIIFLFLGVYIFFLIFLSILVFSFSESLTSLFWEKIFWTIITLFWIIFSSIIFILWTNWECDFIIVSENKIFAVKQISFLNKELIEIDFKNIQEIKSKITGILPTLFGYGEITIKTASGSDDIKFSYIGKPNEVIRKINEIIQENKKL